MTANLDELNCAHKSVQTNNEQFMESPSVKLIKIQKYEQLGISGKCHVTECLISYSPRRETSSISNVKKLTEYFENIIKMNKDFTFCKPPEQRLSLNRRRSLPAHEKHSFYIAKKHGHSETCLLSATSEGHRSKLSSKFIAETICGDSPLANTLNSSTQKDVETLLHETAVTIKKVSSFNRAQFVSTPPPALFREQKKRYTFSGDHPVTSFAEKIKFFNRTSM